MLLTLPSSQCLCTCRLNSSNCCQSNASSINYSRYSRQDLQLRWVSTEGWQDQTRRPNLRLPRVCQGPGHGLQDCGCGGSHLGHSGPVGGHVMTARRVCGRVCRKKAWYVYSTRPIHVRLLTAVHLVKCTWTLWAWCCSPCVDGGRHMPVWS